MTPDRQPTSRRIDHFADLDKLPEHLQDFEPRLLEWARWCKGRAGGNTASSIFRGYRAPSAYDRPVPMPAPVDRDALAIERIVVTLPPMHRDMLQGHYVYGCHPMRLCRTHGVRPADLKRVLDDARTMVRNRYRAATGPAAMKSALLPA